MLIPILLLIIICILLVGAAAIKAAVARQISVVLACLLFAILWRTAKDAPVQFWWAVGALVAAGVCYLLYDWFKVQGTVKKMDDGLHADLVSQGLSKDEADKYLSFSRSGREQEAQDLHLVVLNRQQDVENRSRMAEYGMSPADADRYLQLIRAGKEPEASAILERALATHYGSPPPPGSPDRLLSHRSSS